MNYKRAIGISVLVYLGSMVVGMIACAILGIQPDLSAPIPMEMWLTGAGSSVLLSIGGAYWYFLGKGLKPDAQAGLSFGAAVIVTGFVLDALFFASLSFDGHDPVTVMTMYYSHPMFWVTIALILAGTGGTGWWLQSKKK